MLEDFFTLTEMRDGISTVARIGELVSEIKKLKSAVELNTADLTRQCTTAANTLASTKNEECLQHFVHLNGVGFLHQWLQDAQNCGEDISNAAEDLIVAVLTALECLPVENAQITSCGVLHTVEHLLAHRNADISKRAGVLCHKWSSVQKCSSDVHDMVVKAHDPDQLKLQKPRLESEKDTYDGTNEAAIAGDKLKSEVMVCSTVPLPNHSQTDDSSDIVKQTPVLTPPNSDGNASLGDGNPSVPSLASHRGLENVPVTEESSATNDAKSRATQLSPQDVTTEAKSSGTTNPENPLVSKQMDVQDQNVSTNLDIKKVESFSQDKKNIVEGLDLSPALQDSSDDESTGKDEGPTSSSDTDVKGAVNELRLKRCMKSFGDSSKVVDKKLTADKGDTSKPLAEYDDTDALEVARLVAIEVEREVIDYRGPFCGSPDINSRRSDSPDLEARRQPEPPMDELNNDNKSSTTGEDSGSSSSMKEDGSGITDDSGTFSRKHTRSMKLGGFDLNENQCTEEADCHTKSTLSNSINLSTPIAVAASRTSSVFPARLHFEGELGWKGSAATSAFRPASPRRTPDGEKSVSASSQKTSNALFDLNVSESDNATVGEPLSAAILPLSSNLVPKDASATDDMNRSLELDLNCPCDDEEAAITTSNVPSFWNQQQCNGDWSHPSSSSSSRQPAVRNFDLNDNTPIVDSFSRAVGEPSVKTSGRGVSDHSAVTILGKRIVLGQKEHIHQSEHNFLGPSLELRDPARTIQSYAHTPPDYGVVSYPSQSALSFPPFYAPGTVPYIVDAKGTPVIPPMPGLGVPTPPSLGVGTSHPSFSSRAIPPSSSELSYFHPTMDLNYGRSYEGGRREGASYWPVSFQGQTMFVDERMGNMSQGGSSGVPVLKRKEPDSAWDLYSRR
ncbi:papilin [Oryza brachyantha]|uniref:TFIIS N-terminal domain-containing protein n=1 Tax=Oryza brachyantha TaxID=4533 RepID=J3MG10_ORYBR|nr:papilin [Oryza brachyantha]XP_040380908.1 papilin [Oryza brachyantha]